MKFIAVLALVFFFNKPAISALYCDPDSLTTITITGEVIIQENAQIPHYYLDENFDGEVDYILNFGPFWYSPEDGNAARPAAGDTVAIIGGLNETNPSEMPVIVVYKINNEFWRNPYEPFWNEFNNQYAGWGRDSGIDYCPGWFQNDLSETSFTGAILIDSTFIYLKYFLDVDYDGNIDYKLNFGPPWYSPPEDIFLPEEGDTVTVSGGLIQINILPVIIVFEINGKIWRTGMVAGNQNGGYWMHHSMGQNFAIREFFNDSSRIQYMQGWHHVSMPNQMFGQIIQVHHQNQPQFQTQNGFAGFQIGFFDSDMTNLMQQNNYRLGFNNQVHVQFHFKQKQLDRAGFQRGDKDRIRLMSWDFDRQLWEEITEAVVDIRENLVSYTSDTISGFYMLVVQNETTATKEDWNEDSFLNVYPMPAIDFINIEFELLGKNSSSLFLLDSQGVIIANLLNAEIRMPGKYNLVIDVNIHPSGIYYLYLRTKDYSITTPVIIIR